jgi:uncharacterized protein
MHLPSALSPARVFDVPDDPNVRLTGPYSTGKLPRITLDPVTVTVSRVPKTGRGDEVAVLVNQLAETMRHEPGSLGVGVLRGAEGPDAPWQVVGRFTDAVALRRWETSHERAELLAQLEPIVERVDVAVAASVDGWFEAASVQSERGALLQLLADAVWIYPIAFGVTLLAGDLLGKLPVVERVLASVLLIGVLSTMFVVPTRRALRKLRRRRAPLA